MLNGVTDTGATWRGFDVIKALINRVEERCKTKGCYQRLDFSFSFKLARLREVRSVPYFTEFYKIIRYKIIRRVDGIKDPGGLCNND